MTDPLEPSTTPVGTGMPFAVRLDWEIVASRRCVVPLISAGYEEIRIDITPMIHYLNSGSENELTDGAEGGRDGCLDRHESPIRNNRRISESVLTMTAKTSLWCSMVSTISVAHAATVLAPSTSEHVPGPDSWTNLGKSLIPWTLPFAVAAFFLVAGFILSCCISISDRRKLWMFYFLIAAIACLITLFDYDIQYTIRYSIMFFGGVSFLFVSSVFFPGLLHTPGRFAIWFLLGPALNFFLCWITSTNGRFEWHQWAGNFVWTLVVAFVVVMWLTHHVPAFQRVDREHNPAGPDSPLGVVRLEVTPPLPKPQLCPARGTTTSAATTG